MDPARMNAPAPATHRTTVERTSDRDLVISLTFEAPARAVFDAWTQPALLQRWWAPASTGLSLRVCETDVRAGGRYRFEFSHAAHTSGTLAFFGRYIDVTPGTRLAWTNEESADGAVTTVTFEDLGEQTTLVLHERHATKEALDEAMVGMEGGTPEQFAQLDALLRALRAGRA